MTEIHSFGIDPVTCHSFNANRTKLAISPNNNEVHIHERKGNNWVLGTVLNQHDLRVSSIDWAPVSNRLVTCSADRNAYVWSESPDGSWKPTLVLLRINRAATCVRWSPNGDKFAVGSGAKLISVCYFEEGNDWWISKHIKKQIKSTVTSLDWHPNNSLLACGSTDYKARIYSAFIKEVDKKEPEKTLWGGKPSSGGLVVEFSSSAGSWIHAVSFSPDGNRLAWVSHDSSISVADASKNMTVFTIKTRFLPYLTCVWSSPKFIVAAGHDCYPALFKYDEGSGKLEYIDKIDKSEKKETDGFSAMRKFRDMDKLGFSDVSNGGQASNDALDTIHQNTIVEMRVYATSSKGGVDKLSTVSLDGKMVIWDLGNSLDNSLGGLKINST